MLIKLTLSRVFNLMYSHYI